MDASIHIKNPAFGPDFYLSKQILFSTRISYILPKGSPIKVQLSMHLSLTEGPMQCILQNVFYDATQWLQDTGVLQKMDNDMYMKYGKIQDTILDKTGNSPLNLQHTQLAFIGLLCGLLVSLVAFFTELVGTMACCHKKQKTSGSSWT